MSIGAKLLCGGDPIWGEGFFYEPNLLTGVQPGMTVFDGETFLRPVASIIRDTDAAGQLANANPCVSDGGIKKSGYGRKFSHFGPRTLVNAWTVWIESSFGAIPSRVTNVEVEMKHVHAGVLDVAYLESGPAEGPPVVLLHGFPYDVHCYDVAGERLVAAGGRVIVPFLRGYGSTRFLSASTLRVGQQAALGSDLRALLDVLGIGRATLAGFDWGGRAACVVAALWPERVRGLVTCGTAYNVQSMNTGRTPGTPDAERRHWYWYYLDSDRGHAALTEDRQGLCRFLWRDFSPTWAFDDATFDQTAVAFDNPDFVDVVLHSYRNRIGAVPGDPTLDDLEQRLASQPRITAPTVALAGADDGVDPPEPLDKIAPYFGDLRHQTVLPGVGHNLPQEAPIAFADAVLSLGA